MMRLNQYVEFAKFTGLWVVEFSAKQQAFHIHPLMDACVTNLGMFLNSQPTDYVPVAYARSHDEARAITTVLDRRKDRSQRFTWEQVRRILEALGAQKVIAPYKHATTLALWCPESRNGAGGKIVLPEWTKGHSQCN